MCLAIPGRVLHIAREQELLIGTLEFAGVSRRVCLELIPEVKVGDHVLVYAGHALATVDEAEAQRLLQLLAEMDELTERQAAPE